MIEIEEEEDWENFDSTEEEALKKVIHYNYNFNQGPWVKRMLTGFDYLLYSYSDCYVGQ